MSNNKQEQEVCNHCGGDGIYITNDSERVKCPWCEKGKVPKEEPKQEYPACECGSDWLNTTAKNKPFCFKCGKGTKQELKVGDNTNFGIITDIKEYSVCFGKNKVGVDIWYKKSAVKLIPKQETLEEVLEKYCSHKDDANDRVFYETGVKEILKWQAERMYSEEDMIEFVEWIANVKLHGYSKQLYEAMIIHKVKTSKELLLIWKEQFKNNEQQ